MTEPDYLHWDDGDNAQKIDDYWITHPGTHRTIVDDLAKILPRGESVLEIGCGTGLIAAEMMYRDLVTPATYDGEDVSENMVAIARRRMPEMQFYCRDIEDSSIGTIGTPSNILVIQVIQHLPYYTKALKNVLAMVDKRAYFVSWFAGKDEIKFLKDQWPIPEGYYRNIYELEKFVAAGRANPKVSDVAVHNLGGTTRSVTFALNGVKL